MIRKLIGACVGLAMMAVAGTVHAAVIWQWDGSVLTGASGVLVDGFAYDVTFEDGTCASIFSGCDNAAADFAFTSGALAAAEALRDTVFLDTGINGSPADFNSNPSLIDGCTSALNCNAFIPHDLIGGSVLISGYQNRADPAFDTTFTNSLFTLPFSTAGSGVFDTQRTWAVFSNATAVPIPAALPLMGTCLAILGFIGWRRRKAGAAA